MYCVIQEIEQKKPNKYGESKEIIVESYNMGFNGEVQTKYSYYMSNEKYDRPVKRAYKISIRQSYRENGKTKARQHVLCTVNYYDFIDRWFSLYDYCDVKIQMAADESGIEPEEIYSIVEAKTDTLKKQILDEFSQTEEYATKIKHDEIKTMYSTNKAKFAKQYDIDKDEYDYCYDVFGNLMNAEYLDKIKREYQSRKEYEEKSRSYQEQDYSNYSDYFNGGGSRYSNTTNSDQDREILKQFYRTLSKKYHPDANADIDTEKHMQLLNSLKNEWGV